MVDNAHVEVIMCGMVSLFEKTINASISQDCQTDFWAEKSSLHCASQCNIVTDIPPLRGKMYLSMVANLTSQMSVVGNVVAAQAAAVIGWKESGICFFS